MCLYASMHMKEGMWAGTCVQHVHASALIKARNSCTFALANGCMLFRMCIRKCTHSRSCTSSFFCVFVCIERERERAWVLNRSISQRDSFMLIYTLSSRKVMPALLRRCILKTWIVLYNFLFVTEKVCVCVRMCLCMCVRACMFMYVFICM
jgi:hypothetical protein